MIVVSIILQSGIDGRVEILGTLVVYNIGGSSHIADYRCRMFRKQADGRLPDMPVLLATKPIREGKVTGHRRKAEPVGNLIAKALVATEYGA